jgi:glycosyltransferase involved in cell wall biosynthesis
MDNMPIVLVIAYYFPPMGGAGVQRTLKFVKYLPDFGWQPYILTVRNSMGLQDASLEAETPAGLPINRTPILRLPHRLPWRLRNFINRWFLIIDEQIGWLPFAASAGRKLIAAIDDIRVIYSSSPPYTTHLIARHLHQRTHLPWLADFRDPWMENPFLKFPTTFHRQVNQHLEQSVFNEADRVILNTEVSRQHNTTKYPSLPERKFITIPNGYDQADITNTSQIVQTSPIFTIAHLGSLYPKVRSSKYILAALHDAFQTGKLPPDKIRVRFIGNIDKETQGLVRQYKLNGNVELLGYLNHRQALSHLFSADLLLLLPYYDVGGELSIPAKTYEYLASKKPILCLADPGACAELIHKARAGTVVPPTDISKIVDQLFSLYQQWENGELKIDPDQELIASFERRKLTGRLANLLTEVSA